MIRMTFWRVTDLKTRVAIGKAIEDSRKFGQKVNRIKRRLGAVNVIVLERGIGREVVGFRFASDTLHVEPGIPSSPAIVWRKERAETACAGYWKPNPKAKEGVALAKELTPVEDAYEFTRVLLNIPYWCKGLIMTPVRVVLQDDLIHIAVPSEHAKCMKGCERVSDVEIESMRLMKPLGLL